MTTAIITASYSKDFERCQLLCQSVDRHLKGDWKHYILVDEIDVAMFSSLQSEHRAIISERKLFPFWCRSFPDPISTRHSRMWLTPFSKPLRGWHAQQLRRLAIARKISEDIMLTLDSDVVMVRDFDVNELGDQDAMRFHRIDDAFDETMQEHILWSKNAGKILGLGDNSIGLDDYITTFIAWRRESICAMLDHIEKYNGCHWMRAMVRYSDMSECMIYGRFVDEIELGKHHLPTPHSLCHVLWDENSAERSVAGLRGFIKAMSEEQVAVGIQSFVGVEMNDIRQVLNELDS